MWLKAYMNWSEDRPTWAFLADDLLATYVTKDCRPRKAELRINPFLQHWKPKVRGLPKELSGMMKVAKKYGLRLEGLAFSREILGSMPMWDHIYADRAKMGRLIRPSKILTCLQATHEAKTVNDFVNMAEILGRPEHRPKARCPCTGCVRLRDTLGCANPHLCCWRAKEMVSTLPGKWNPRLRQPIDYEEKMTENLCQENLGADLVPFDRRITTRGDLGQAFRIFTEGEGVSNDSVEMALDEDGQNRILATDGSCIHNGERRAQAGAGVYVEDEPSRNVCFRLPESLDQSNQSAEVMAALLATKIA
ncbi:hypothetical protein K466DRAFT_612850, partial [Polyporus arcularius HHB13444]